MDKRAFGKRLQKYRSRFGYSQETLAEKIEKSSIFVSYMERGAKAPSVDTLIRISEVLNISMDILLGNEAKKNCKANLSYVEERIAGLPLQEKDRILEIIDAVVEIELKYMKKDKGRKSLKK